MLMLEVENKLSIPGDITNRIVRLTTVIVAGSVVEHFFDLSIGRVSSHDWFRASINFISGRYL